MMWFRVSWLVLVLVVVASARVCPDSCLCSTTRDGLHRAACSDLSSLYKYTLRQKHHNINILDLSHNNITRLTHELDRLTEVVTLDLSTNGITQLNKFLNNAKKLVHLNLANNRIAKLSMTRLPTSVSSLDLTNNMLKDVPFDIEHLKGLEHLEMEGNPLDCSCDNIRARDHLIGANVFIDNVKCLTPLKFKGRSWLELKTKDVCKVPRNEYFDMMMGDQPIDAIQIGEETTALKAMPLTANNDLEDGHVIKEDDPTEDDDSLLFMKVNKPVSTLKDTKEIEGSGEEESTSVTDTIIEPRRNWKSHSSIEVEDKTEDPLYEEGSGFSGIYEGSGFASFDESHEKVVETTTTFRELYTGPVIPLILDDDVSEFITPKTPTLYAGGADWNSRSYVPEPTKGVENDISATTQTTRDTTLSERIRVTQTAEINESPSSSDKPAPHKTGTYICIAIIVVLLVGLIGFAIAKGQIRKRRDRRLLRQQKRDVEQASKEMVDMNKSLLGKAALIDAPIEKKLNGKYELVPTHEKIQKSENGDLGNGIKHNETNGKRTESPRDTNQNKNSSKDNNLVSENDTTSPVQDTSFDSQPSTESRKDTHSLSSEDIFVPLIDDDTPTANGALGLDSSQPLINGDMNIDTDFLSPREYIPVYSPDMGRVRIKLSETPKPKTPVLVTRSRSNAGDIIITPALDATKSTT